MSELPRIAVVIPNFNGATIISYAIDSILAQDYPRFELIVIENGSSDDSLSVLADYAEQITVIKNPVNLGFAGGVNVGIDYAIQHKFEAVALFNSDAVAEPDWLLNLAKEFVSRPGTGIITGKLQLAPTPAIDSTGEFYSIWGMPFPRGRGEPIDHYSNGEFVFGATGGASLYRCEMLQHIGWFDESFFAYYEDVDISFRAQLNGWTVYYTPQAVAHHQQGATSKRIPGFAAYQTFKNLPLLLTKNVPASLLLPILLRFWLLYILMFGKAVRVGNGWAALKGWLMSIWLFWTRSIWQRIRIQRQSQVSKQYIASLLYHDLPPGQTGMRRLQQKLFGR